MKCETWCSYAEPSGKKRLSLSERKSVEIKMVSAAKRKGALAEKEGKIGAYPSIAQNAKPSYKKGGSSIDIADWSDLCKGHSFIDQLLLNRQLICSVGISN